jgi:putative PEP-CTERM system TPR-repeat lipoprotein
MFREGITLFRKIIAILTVLFLLAGCGKKTKEELLNDGLKLMKEDKPSGAIVLFKNALEMDQNYFEARYQLARAYAAAGKYGQAEKEFQKVLRLNPARTDIQLEIARVYLYTNKPDEAVSMARNYSGSYPDKPEALEIIAQGYSLKNKPEDAEEYFLKALKLDPEMASAKLGLAGLYIAKSDERNARRLLDEIINKDKKDTKAYYMLAGLETSLAKRDKALEAYQRIAEINPADINAIYRSGLLYIDKGELDKTEKIADDLLAKYPKHPEGHSLKGVVLYYRKKFNEAIVELQNSLKMRPDMGTYYFLGLSHYNIGEFEQSLSQFQRVLDFNPSFTRARLMVSIILLKQKRVDDSIAEARKILQEDEKNALAHNILGSAYMAKGMYDEAMKELNRAIEADPKLVDAHLKKGLFSFAMGNPKGAETELKTAVQVAPELLNTRLILFSYYLKQKNYDKAVQTLQEGITGKKEDALLYNNMAGALSADKKPAEAIKYLQKAKEANPDYFPPYFNLAAYYAVKGEHDKAMNEYRTVLKRDPKNVAAMLSMASTLELKGRDNEAAAYYENAKETKEPAGFLALAGYFVRKKDTDRAIGVLDEAIKANPENIAAMEMKGRIYLSEKKYKDALRAFEELETVNPDTGLPYIVNTHIAMQDYKGALKKLDSKLKANPERLDLMAEISRIYALMKDTQRAAENARKIISKKPDSAYGYTVLALIHESQNDLNGAIDALKKGLAVDGKNPDVRMMLGNLYARKREYPSAITTYNEIVQKNPNYIPAVFAQGAIYDIMGNKKEAAKKYHEVLAKSENHVPALNNLAFLYADGHGSKAEALKLALKAYSLAPNDASVMDTVGYALLKNGKTDDAVKMLEKAVSILPDNPSVRYHLALAYKQNNKIDKAREQIAIALKKNDFPEAASARKLFEEMKGK